MGAITGTVLAGISAATAIASTVDGISKSNKAEKALDNLQTPELNNPYKDISVSTMGSDLIREEGQRVTANILGGMQGGSARTMLSGLPQLAAFTNSINQKAALDIDNQMQKREYGIAGYEAQINGIEENRYQGEIAGAGSLYNYGQQQMWNGIKGTISGLGATARSIDGNVIEPLDFRRLGGMNQNGNQVLDFYSMAGINQNGRQGFNSQNNYPEIKP